MIISFDGNVYTGKTTLIHSLQSRLKNTFIIPEYQVDNRYLQTHCHYEGQQFFLHQEQSRMTETTPDALILLDRSFDSKGLVPIGGFFFTSSS